MKEATALATTCQIFSYDLIYKVKVSEKIYNNLDHLSHRIAADAVTSGLLNGC